MTDDYQQNPLWLILVETVQNLPLYPSHKAYVRDNILPFEPNITPEQLSRRLNMPLGEAIVILTELGIEKDIQNED
jgi:hypothetical protein